VRPNSEITTITVSCHTGAPISSAKATTKRPSSPILVGVGGMELPVEPFFAAHRGEAGGAAVVGAPGDPVEQQQVGRLRRSRGGGGVGDERQNGGEGTHAA
jgi:hypothetical protein